MTLIRDIVDYLDDCPWCGRDVERPGPSIELVKFEEPIPEPPVAPPVAGGFSPEDRFDSQIRREEYIEVSPCSHHFAETELLELRHLVEQLEDLRDEDAGTVAGTRQATTREQELQDQIAELKDSMAPFSVRHEDEPSRRT